MHEPRLREDFEIPAPLKAVLERELSSERVVLGRVGGEVRVGLVLKRSYRVGADGRCEPAPEDEQEFVVDQVLHYHDLEPPRMSPVVFDDETAAFRAATDVVVQGYAQSYGQVIDRAKVAMAIGDWRRDIQVHGDRRVELHQGALRFTPPEPFEVFPIRYDYAYGGYDARALERYRNPALEALAESHPRLNPLKQTPFHYPRNPSGRGYRMRVDAESIDGLEVPNLEFPFDPVTPERLAVGDPGNWLQAPLPAGTDWIHPGWFPRIAYLGLAFVSESRRQDRVPEIEYGWAAPDLLQIPPLPQQQEGARPEALQAASPGLVFPQVDLRWEIVFENWHPEQPSWRVQLPDEVPAASLQLGIGGPTSLTPHLNAIVIRPEYDEVVTTWCASAPAPRQYSEDQLQQLEHRVDWRRGG